MHPFPFDLNLFLSVVESDSLSVVSLALLKQNERRNTMKTKSDKTTVGIIR